MKVSFPLSLKVSLWLLLNLVLLTAVGGGFLVRESGFNWDALVAGRAGARLQTVGEIIAVELRTAAPTARDEVLRSVVTDHFGEAEPHGAKFYLFQNNGRQLAGPTVTLPVSVRLRLLEGGRGPGQRGGGQPAGARGNNRGGQPPGPDGGRGLGPPPTEPDGARGLGPPAGPDGVRGLGSPPPVPGVPPEAGVGTPPAGGRPPASPRDARFLVRAQDATGYWAGVRLGPIGDTNGGYLPASTLLMQADSLGAIVPLLDLTPWLIAAAAAMGLSVLFWLPLVRSITYSLGQLTRATEQIAEGRFDTRVNDKRRDELGRLGGAVNRMAVQLDRAATGQKRFLGDIAHELGSPVGRLQVAVGILEASAAPALRPAVDDVREEVEQMSGLVGELLAFTKAGLKPRDAALDAVRLAALAGEVLARENAGTGTVTVDIPAVLSVQADAPLLARALANLVRNALRYAGAAGPVMITARAEGPDIVLAVEDHGPGVPADTLTRLGEPFYRPEFARTRETGGAGLGLAIVKSAVEACRGTVRFSNREPHGFRAEVRLASA
jgi:two-component system sensor histidine kinase CpxA